MSELRELSDRIGRARAGCAEFREGDSIQVLQTWMDPSEWWPACVRKTRGLDEGGSFRALLAGEAFGPNGAISTFAVFVDDEGKTWRRAADDDSHRLAAVADELGCDSSAAIFHARETVRERDRWAGIVKKRELTIERLRSILDGKIDPVLLENDRLRRRVAVQHESLMEIALASYYAMHPGSDGGEIGFETPEPHEVLAEVRAALELLTATRKLVQIHAQPADDSAAGRALHALHDLLFPLSEVHR